MAVPTVQSGMSREQRPPESKLAIWTRRLGSSLSRPLIAVVLALVAGGIVVMLTSGDPFAAYLAMFQGAFGDLQSLSYTLVLVEALIFAGLSVAIANRAGLFNIGAQGQLAVGAMTAGVIAFEAPKAPGWLLIPVMIIGSALAGAIWGGIVGLLKAWRGSHEVVTTIMLNWIAFYISDYLISGPFKAPQQSNQTPAIPLQATLPRISSFYNETLGTFLPQIPQPEQYLVDMSFFLALLAIVVYWFITQRTTFGYEIRVIGQNPKAAQYAGIPVKRNIVMSMALAGAFAGLAGSLHLMGQYPYQLIGQTFAIDTTGFDAIGVALLGNTTPIGILLGSLFFGGLHQGGSFMQISTGTPIDIYRVIEALVLLFITAQFIPGLQRYIPNWLRFKRQPLSISPVVVAKASDSDNGVHSPLPPEKHAQKVEEQ